MFKKDLVVESLRSGTIASLVMMPAGFVFRLFDLRVGHYGDKLGALIFGAFDGTMLQFLLFVQHLVIGWVSTTPLLLVLMYVSLKRWLQLTAGAVYGVTYYMGINCWFLPLVFGDVSPVRLGFDYVYPSLVVHVVFGLSIAFTASAFVKRYSKL